MKLKNKYSLCYMLYSVWFFLNYNWLFIIIWYLWKMYYCHKKFNNCKHKQITIYYRISWQFLTNSGSKIKSMLCLFLDSSFSQAVLYITPLKTYVHTHTIWNNIAVISGLCIICSTQVDILHYFEYFYLSVQESETKLMPLKKNG